MGKMVINPFLTEEHVSILYTEKLLQDFALCSKQVIISSVSNYINNTTNEDVKEMLLSVFKDKIDFMNTLKDEVAVDLVNKVHSYVFDSVHAGLSVAELTEMKNNINEVYTDKKTIPYINVIPSNIIENIISNLMALHRVNRNSEYKQLAYMLSKNKELFKDKPNANAKGTIYKGISSRSTDLDIIKLGIDFLIDQKTKGNAPESWRVY